MKWLGLGGVFAAVVAAASNTRFALFVRPAALLEPHVHLTQVGKPRRVME